MEDVNDFRVSIDTSRLMELSFPSKVEVEMRKMIDYLRACEREYREESHLVIPPKAVSGKTIAHQMVQEGYLKIDKFIAIMDAIEHCYNPYVIKIIDAPSEKSETKQEWIDKMMSRSVCKLPDVSSIEPDEIKK